MEGRVLRWLGTAVPVVLSLVLLMGFFLPVYSDEIGWRFQERAWFDGVDKMFSEVCGPNTLAVPPRFMMPVRWYSAFFNSAFADPFWVRVSGVLYALIWLAMALVLIRRLTQDRQNRAIMSAMGLGLLMLGTMPLLLVWSRPEQPIMLVAVGLILIALADGVDPALPRSTAQQAWGRSLLILVLTCIAISYHMKGLFLLPLILACLFFASRGPKAHVPRLTAGVLILAAILSALTYWRHRLDCPGNAQVSHVYNLISLNGAIANVSSVAEAKAVAAQMLDTVGILSHVANIGPRPDPMAAWLELNQIGKQASFQWFVALSLVWSLALCVAAVAAAASAWRNFRDRRLDPRLVLGAICFGIAMIWSATLPVPNVYEAKFFLVLLVVAVILVLSTVSSDRLKPWLNMTGGIVGLAALISPFAIGAIYAPSLARSAAEQGRIRDQPYSVSVFGYSKLKPDIEAAAKLCGIGDPAGQRALMIDDVTYFSFMRSKLPQHELGVVRGWSGNVDSIAYLRSRGSTGAVVSCSILKPAMRARARSAGKFCCLGPPNW